MACYCQGTAPQHVAATSELPRCAQPAASPTLTSSNKRARLGHRASSWLVAGDGHGAAWPRRLPQVLLAAWRRAAHVACQAWHVQRASPRHRAGCAGCGVAQRRGHYSQEQSWKSKCMSGKPTPPFKRSRHWLISASTPKFSRLQVSSGRQGPDVGGSTGQLRPGGHTCEFQCRWVRGPRHSWGPFNAEAAVLHEQRGQAVRVLFVW